MNSEWVKVQLGDLINIKHGYAFKGSNFSDAPTEYILVTPGNFKIGGGFKNEKFKFYSGEFPEEYILKDNDLIVTMTDLSKLGDTLGYSALVPLSPNHLFLHNQRIGLVEILKSESDVDKLFIYWLMRSPFYQKYIVNYSTGTSVKHTSPTSIKNFTFLLPSLPIQQKIASILSALDDKIELNNKINENLEQQAQAIFKNWFVDFKPWGGTTPVSWKQGTLGDILCSIESGSRPKGGAILEGIPSIGAENIERFGQYDYSKEKYIDSAFFQKIKRGIVKSGDVLLYKDGAYTGKVSMSLDGFPHTVCAINEHVFILRTNDYCPSQFFLYLLLLLDENRSKLFTMASSKAAQPGLNQSEVSCLPIIIPEKNVIKDFDSKISPLMHKIANNSLESRALSMLRDSLLPKLMSGEIDVSNVSVESEDC